MYCLPSELITSSLWILIFFRTPVGLQINTGTSPQHQTVTGHTEYAENKEHAHDFINWWRSWLHIPEYLIHTCPPLLSRPDTGSVSSLMCNPRPRFCVLLLIWWDSQHTCMFVRLWLPQIQPCSRKHAFFLSVSLLLTETACVCEAPAAYFVPFLSENTWRYFTQTLKNGMWTRFCLGQDTNHAQLILHLSHSSQTLGTCPK